MTCIINKYLHYKTHYIQQKHLHYKTRSKYIIRTNNIKFTNILGSQMQ